MTRCSCLRSTSSRPRTRSVIPAPTPVFCDIAGDDDLNVRSRGHRSRDRPADARHRRHALRRPPVPDGAILELAAQHGLALIEDAAHAPGRAMATGRCAGRSATSAASASSRTRTCPSARAGWSSPTTTRSPSKARLLRSHGMTTLTWDRHRGHASTYDVVVRRASTTGWTSCARRSRSFSCGASSNRTPQRARIVDLYRDAFDGVNGLSMPFAPQHRRDARAPSRGARSARGLLDRDDVPRVARGARVQTSVHYPPIHHVLGLRATSARDVLCRSTEAVAPRLVTLPLYPHMSIDDVSAVTDAVLAAT